MQRQLKDVSPLPTSGNMWREREITIQMVRGNKPEKYMTTTTTTEREIERDREITRERERDY